MIRVRVFSAIYGGIRRVKRHHSGVVGRLLGKDLGKEFSRALSQSAKHRSRSGEMRQS
jgi:stress-induced morphogen